MGRTREINWDTIGHERESDFSLSDSGRTERAESRGGTNRGGEGHGDELEVRKAEDDALDQLLRLQLAALCRALAAGVAFIAVRAYLRWQCTLSGDAGAGVTSSSFLWSNRLDAALAAGMSAMLLAGLRVQRIPPRLSSDDASAPFLPQWERFPSDASLYAHRLLFAAKVASVAVSVALLRARARDPTCAAARGPLACAQDEHASTVSLHSLLLMAALRPAPRRLVFTEATRQALCAVIMLPLALSPDAGGAAARLAAAARVLAAALSSCFVSMLLASIYSDPGAQRSRPAPRVSPEGS